MGTVFKKQVTRPLPTGAEIITRRGERLARWKDGRGKTRTAPVISGRNGTERIHATAGTYTAKYRDGSGIVREASTGCRDKDAALSRLKELTDRAERVRAKILTADEANIADHQDTPLDRHFDAYLVHLESRQTSPHHRKNVRGCLRRLADECSFRRLCDLNAEAVERWLLRAERDGMGARTRNRHLSAVSAFANWCIEAGRLAFNPFARIGKANEKADRRRQRRSMTEDELSRLLYLAHRRPLAEHGRETIRNPTDGTNGRKTRKKEPLTLDNVEATTERARQRLEGNPNFVEQQERLGWERALIYKTLILTGLRRGELASLTVGRMHLDGSTPLLDLDAAAEKNREGSQIPLRRDLAADLDQWLADRRERLRGAAVVQFGQPGTVRPDELPADEPLFNVPTGLGRILDRDLKAAGIPKRDERGWTLDVHALRHTFGTLLSKYGVAPRTAQAAMRHSEIGLTMNTYTDPRLLDVHAAMESLPTLPLDGRREKRLQATGTEGERSLVAPNVAPKSGKACKPGSTVDKRPARRESGQRSERVAVSAETVKGKTPLSTADTGVQQERVTGLGPATFSLGSCGLSNATVESKGLTETAPARCTTGCTSEADLQQIAAELRSRFSADDCRRLAGLLSEGGNA